MSKQERTPENPSEYRGMIQSRNGLDLNTLTNEQRIQHDQISQYFHLPLLEASIHLKMEMQEIRNICRDLGYGTRVSSFLMLGRWPYYSKRENSTNSQGPNDPVFSHFEVEHNFMPGEQGNKGGTKKDKKSKDGKLDIKNLIN